MAYIPNSGSVVAFQSQPSSLLVGASIIGLTPVAVTNFTSVLLGSSNASIITVGGTTGNSSVTAYQGGNWITSVVNTIPSSMMVGASIFGTVPVTQSTSPWIVNMPSPSVVSTQIAGSVMAVNFPSPSTIAYQLAGSIMAVSGSFSAGNTSVTAYQGGAWSHSVTGGYLNVIGSIATVPPSGTWITSVMNTVPSSMLVGASIMGTVPVTQSTSPWVVNVPTSSYISYQAAGSVMAVSGSFNTGNSSVQLLSGVGVIGSVAVLQGTNPWIVNQPSPSIIATQIAGSVMNVNISPSVIAYQLAGSILAVSGSFNGGNSSVQLLAGTNAIGSVTTLQGTNPWIVNMPSSSVIAYQLAGSIMAVSATVNTGNSSVQLVSGTATIGSVVGIQGTNPYIMTGSIQGTVSVLGTVPVTQSTSPWVVNVPTSSYISYQLAGSVMAVSATVNTGNSSVQLLGGVAAIGSVATLQGTNPWITQIIGSVALGVGNTSVTQAGAWNVNVNSILGTYQEKSATVASAIGIPFLWKSNFTTSVLSTVSTNDPLPVQGSVTTLQGTNPWIVNSIGSVAAALQSTNASVVAVWGTFTRMTSVMSTIPSSMMVGASIFGTVPVTQGTNPWVIGSIVGTFGEDTAHALNDKGLFVLGVRNDTLSSVTSADVNYTRMTVGPSGEVIVANSPITKWVRGIGSVFTGTSVQVLAPQGSSIFTYVTGLQVTNASANNVYLTFTGGLGGITSTLGYTVAPANGGSNINIPNAWVTGANSGFSASVSGVASIYLAVQGFISKT